LEKSLKGHIKVTERSFTSIGRPEPWRRRTMKKKKQNHEEEEEEEEEEEKKP